jgi:CzcA family heavy metal efflux pump
MLNGLIKWSIQNRWVVTLLAVLMLVGGIYTTVKMPLDVFPDFAPVQVVVLTEAPGFAPEEVESTITLPLETSLNGIPNVQTVRSISTVGLSVITLIFQDNTNIFTARQLVSERLQAARERLPGSVKEPVLAPITSAAGDVFKLGLYSTTGETSPRDLRTLVDWTIRPRIMAVNGVSNIVIHGGEVKQYQVLVNPTKLRQYDVTLQQVIEAAGGSTANASGGVLRTPQEEYLIRGLGRAKSPEEIAQTVVTSRQGLPVLIGNIATVQVGSAMKVGDGIIDGKPGVVMTVLKQPWANTLQTTYAIELTLKELQASFPKDVKLVAAFRQADFIEVAVKNIFEAIALGGILVVVVLFIFLQNWRAAFISLTAIPLSLLAAIVCIKLQGGTINTMTLGGLAIAIGEVVDDAIIDVENVYRRLRENKAAGVPLHPMRVVYEASREVRSSVVYATFIVALVFLPIFSLSGLEGKIFSPLGSAYLIALLASLLVALTVTPAMSYLLLSKAESLPNDETSFVKWLKSRYESLLNFSFNNAPAVLSVASALFVVSLIPLAVMGREFLPEFDENNVIIVANSIPGTSLETTTRMGTELTGHFVKEHNVMAADQRAGRAEGGEDYGAGNFSEYDIRLKPESPNRKDVLYHVRHEFAHVPGLVVNTGSYLAHRMDHVLSGVNAAIAVKLYGPDLEVLHEKSKLIEAAVKKVKGTADVQIEPVIPVPQISIQIDRAAAARYGVRVKDLAQAIEVAFRGKTVSQVLEGQRMFDLNVWFEPQYRNDINTIRETLLDTPSGAKVPLGALALVNFGKSPNTISHENLSRRVVIQANVAGRDLGSVIQDMREIIATNVQLPAGYFVVYGGQFEAQEQATRQLLILGVVALIGMFFLLLMAFKSWRAAAIVMANLPLALIGGIWAAFFTGAVLSVGSLVGFITLFGLSTRNGIMMVSHFNHLKGEGKLFDHILWEGSLDRLSPVLMTALTAALGVLPIAVLGGAGRELEQPLAIVIVGGMSSSTALTLIVIPALFKLFGKSALHGMTADNADVFMADLPAPQLASNVSADVGGKHVD